MTSASKPRSRAGATLAIGIGVATLFLYLALRNTEPSSIVASLKHSNFWFVPLIAAALFLQFWFKAMRWRLLLNPFAQSTTGQVYPATVVGYLANLVFPIYIGEIARIYVLARQLDLRYSPVLATVVLERFFDFVSVLLIVGLILIFDPNVPAELNTVGLVAGAASLALFAALSVVLLYGDAISRLITRLTAFLPDSARQKVVEQFQSGLLGLQSIRDLRALPGIVVTSLLQWGAMGICIYLGMLGTGVNAPISAGFVVLALTVMGVTLPSSPGFFGTIQLCFTLGLAPYGIDASNAFAASLLFHLTIYIAGWLGGLYFLRRSGMTLSRLRAVSIESDSITENRKD